MLEDTCKVKLLIDFDSQNTRSASPTAYSVESSSKYDDSWIQTEISFEEDSGSPTAACFPPLSLRSRTLPTTLSDKSDDASSSLEVTKHKRTHSFSKSNCIPDKVYLCKRNGRTISGTEVIRSFACLTEVFSDCYIQDSSSESHCLSEQFHPSSDDLSLDFNSIMTTQPSLLSAGKSPSRWLSLPAWEIKRSSQIMVTGGPLPGFYDMKGRIHGRPSWYSEKAVLYWSIKSKAWLLSGACSRRGTCLAILLEDTINPCYSHIPWRVSSSGSANSTNEVYLFKPDKHMVCIPCAGTGILDKPMHMDIEENVIVRVRRGLGIARFIGKLEDQDGTFVGVELFVPTGLNNGTRKGFFYFEAKQDHGVFVRCPEGVIEQFGHVTDKCATIMGNLLSAGKKIRRLNRNLENHVIRTLIATAQNRSIFCACRIEILEIILFYELIMIC